MRVRWFGQSAFQLEGEEGSVAIDPFGDLSGMTARGIKFDYPAIEDVQSDLVLVTHEHADHNGVEAIGGEPDVLRATAGRLESPVGEVLAVASEHDENAGTDRGPNTIFVFTLDGVRTCHFGDFGQRALREEQAAAIGEVDLLFLPVGGGPTIGAAQAQEVVARLQPRWVVPMHYRTERIGFLESADGFLARYQHVERPATSEFDTSELPHVSEPLIIAPAAP